MQLSQVEPLTADYSQDDVSELVAVIQTTRLSSPSAVLRWGKISPSDLEDWLRRSCTGNLKSDFQLERISSIRGEDELPSIPLVEHLVVRDFDMIHLGTDQDRLAPGRIVAHAEYHFILSYGTPGEGTQREETPLGPSISCPPGFGQGLHLQIGKMVRAMMISLFSGLPCFELHSISTLTPSHLRKGIAKRLTEWIFPYADQLALPVVLSASPLGLLLYNKCGFVEYRQYDVVIELEEWGGDGLHKLVTMVRWPGRIECLPDAWKEWRNTHKMQSETEVKVI